MSHRTIQECDRCRREIRRGAAVVVRIDGDDKDFCKGCKHDFDQFMQNTPLEEPP